MASRFSELAYSNTVYTISSTGNTITLLAPSPTAADLNAYTRYAGKITANEYLSPQTFVTQFNKDVLAIITAANTVAAGTFPTDASLVLTYDTNTTKMTLSQKKMGFEILVNNGSDILKILGQGTALTDLRDLLMPPILPMTYHFLEPSDYLTKRWDQVAMTGASFDPSNGQGNCRINLVVYYWEPNIGNPDHELDNYILRRVSQRRTIRFRDRLSRVVKR